MPCTAPIDAWRPSPNAPNRRLVFSPSKGAADLEPLKIPCGGCLSCRLSKSQQWAIRCTHEAKMFDHNVFATFTFNDEHLPDDYSVRVRDLQLLHKLMRQKYGPFRFFACGENGDQYGRPHYHAIYFGLELPDLRAVDRSSSGELLYESASLTKLWGKGRVILGTVTYQSAGYVARYSLKKQKAADADEYHTYLHPVTGELIKVSPPFVVMSRRPGVGITWLEKFHQDAFPSDFVMVEGVRRPVPQAYARWLEAHNSRLVQSTARRRRREGEARSDREAAMHAASGYGQSRLLTKHQLVALRAKQLLRPLEGEGT